MLAAKLPEIEKRLDHVLKLGDLTHASTRIFTPILQQARLLAKQYDVVAANPPYMGAGNMNAHLKEMVRRVYQEASGDLASAFVIRSVPFLKHCGFVGMITFHNWMFVGTFESFRRSVISNYSISTLIHIGRGVWGADFGSVAFVLHKAGNRNFAGTYRRLFVKSSQVPSQEDLIQRFFNTADYPKYSRTTSSYERIPECPIAYWISEGITRSFEGREGLDSVCTPKTGLSSGDKDRFCRRWHEVSVSHFGRPGEPHAGKRWLPITSGGPFRKWYGNCFEVIRWDNDGQAVLDFTG